MKFLNEIQNWLKWILNEFWINWEMNKFEMYFESVWNELQMEWILKFEMNFESFWNENGIDDLTLGGRDGKTKIKLE